MCETSVKLQRPAEVFLQGVALQGGGGGIDDQHKTVRIAQPCNGRANLAKWESPCLLSAESALWVIILNKEGLVGPKWNYMIFEKHRVCSAKAQGGVDSGMEPRVQCPHEVGGGTFRDRESLAAPRKVRRIEE